MSRTVTLHKPPERLDEPINPVNATFVPVPCQILLLPTLVPFNAKSFVHVDWFNCNIQLFQCKFLLMHTLMCCMLSIGGREHQATEETGTCVCVYIYIYYTCLFYFE